MMRREVVLAVGLFVFGGAIAAVAHEPPVPPPPMLGLPPAHGVNYFNETYAKGKVLPGCFRWRTKYLDSKPYVVTLRGTLVERTFYGPPWVTDAGTPRGVLLIRLDRPLSICGIPTLSKSPKMVNVGGITGLSIPWWLGFTVEWRNDGMKLTKLVGEQENGYSLGANQQLLDPYLDKGVEIVGYLSGSNFATPWVIDVLRVCLVDRGRARQCRGQLPAAAAVRGHALVR